MIKIKIMEKIKMITARDLVNGLTYIILKGREGGKYKSRKKVVDTKTGKMRWGGYVYNNPKSERSKSKESKFGTDNKGMSLQKDLKNKLNAIKNNQQMVNNIEYEYSKNGEKYPVRATLSAVTNENHKNYGLVRITHMDSKIKNHPEYKDYVPIETAHKIMNESGYSNEYSR